MRDKSSPFAINSNRFGPSTLLMDKLCMPSDENFNKLNNSMKFVSENDISVLMVPSRAENRTKKKMNAEIERRNVELNLTKREKIERQREREYGEAYNLHSKRMRSLSSDIK